MATKFEVGKILAVLWESFPNMAKPTLSPRKEIGEELCTADVWHRVIGDLDYAVLNAALAQVISEPRQFAPSAGELRAVAAKLLVPDAPLALEGWGLCCKAIGMFEAGDRSTLTRFPPEYSPNVMAHVEVNDLKDGFFRVVEHRSEMALAWIGDRNPIAAKAAREMGWLRWYESSADEEMSWRSQFVKFYEAYAQRQEVAARELPAVAEFKQLERAKQVRAGVGDLAKKLAAPNGEKTK